MQPRRLCLILLALAVPIPVDAGTVQDVIDTVLFWRDDGDRSARRPGGGGGIVDLIQHPGPETREGPFWDPFGDAGGLPGGDPLWTPPCEPLLDPDRGPGGESPGGCGRPRDSLEQPAVPEPATIVLLAAGGAALAAARSRSGRRRVP